MRRLVSAVLLLTLVLTACPDDTDYDCDTPGTAGCPTLSAIPSSASPSATTPGPSASASITPSRTQPPQPSCATYPGRVYPIVIKDTTGYKPESVNLLRGDWILFKNDDPRGSHSLTVDGTTLDSGLLKPGQQKKMRVLLPVKLYSRWHDREIGYIQGGPLGVNANARCP